MYLLKLPLVVETNTKLCFSAIYETFGISIMQCFFRVPFCLPYYYRVRLDRVPRIQKTAQALGFQSRSDGFHNRLVDAVVRHGGMEFKVLHHRIVLPVYSLPIGERGDETVGGDQRIAIISDHGQRAGICRKATG